MAAYRIFTDATADMPGFSTAGLPPVVTIPMQVEVNGQEFIYGPDGDLSVNMFYQMQRSGKFAHTTQVSPSVYFEYFTPYLCQGIDILYLCFSSGMSGTFQSANLCMEELKHEYPERTILCIDTLCASVGEGFLVWEAARKQAEGASLSELAAWVSEHRLQVCHWFTVDTFEHLRHGGRVSSAAAVMGTALQIKPLLYVDEQGCLQVKQKLRGRKKAIAEQLLHMEREWMPELGKQVFIGHGDDLQAAQQLREAVIARFPEAEIAIADIGPIIGAHTGPGMLALIYWGPGR